MKGHVVVKAYTTDERRASVLRFLSEIADEYSQVHITIHEIRAVYGVAYQTTYRDLQWLEANEKIVWSRHAGTGGRSVITLTGK